MNPPPGAELPGNCGVPFLVENKKGAPQVVSTIKPPGHNFSYSNSLETGASSPDAFCARSGDAFEGVRVLVRRGYFNLIDLRFFFPSPGLDERRAVAWALQAAEPMLGEETLARWIGDIDVRLQSAGGECTIGLDEMPAAVLRLVEQAEAELPDRPWHQMHLASDWTAVEGDPDEAEDYPDQCDLVAGTTALPAMWQNARSSTRFDSGRFSRFGERFCYLKTDGAAGWEYARFADREEIEKAIDAPLRRAGLGGVVGGGTGLRYSYIELALADVEQAWLEIGAVLSDARLPKRTWLLHHDAELSSQWRGLYDDTPRPPVGRPLRREDRRPQRANSGPACELQASIERGLSGGNDRATYRLAGWASS